MFHQGVGQISKNCTPIKRIAEGGYFFAEYGDKDVTHNSVSRIKQLLQQVIVRAQLRYATGLNGRSRDFSFFLGGMVLVSILFGKSRKKSF